MNAEDFLKTILSTLKRRGVCEVTVKIEKGKLVILAVSKERIE